VTSWSPTVGRAAGATPAAQPGITEASESLGTEEAEVVAAREDEGGRVVGNATTIVLVENIAIFFLF
jgi:hypothetical protein